MSAADQRWIDLLTTAGVVENDSIAEITVLRAGASVSSLDIALCGADQACDRAERMRLSNGHARNTTPERAFLSRALREHPETTVALVTRAAIASWVGARGAHRPADKFEKRALALAEAHLFKAGHAVDDDLLRHRHHLAKDRLPAPVSHSGPDDVIRKAVARLARQIDGRVAVVP